MGTPNYFQKSNVFRGFGGFLCHVLKKCGKQEVNAIEKLISYKI